MITNLEMHARNDHSRDGTSVLADINGANVAAGLTAGLFYTFGAIPIHLSAMAALGLSQAAATSWFFITFMTSAISGLILSIKFRAPIPVGWTMPGLVFLAGSAGRYSHAEMVGAFLVAGTLIVLLGLIGLGEQLMRWLPLPIVMGMFAGNVLGYVTGIFGHLEAQPWVVGMSIAGYVGARAMGKVWMPPMAGAVLFGITAAAVSGQVHPASFQWSAPAVALIAPEFDLQSLFALSIPLVVMAIGMGNVQGFGILLSQGYRLPVRSLTVWMGVTTLINALFGGHTSSLQNNGAAILGGPDAGPREGRYMANVVAASIAVVLAVCAAAAGTLLGVLPPGLVPALAGLALISAMVDALQKATKTDLPMGAFFALIIASSSLTILGIGATFWALIGGLMVSFALERPALEGHWGAATPGLPPGQKLHGPVHGLRDAMPPRAA